LSSDRSIVKLNQGHIEPPNISFFNNTDNLKKLQQQEYKSDLKLSKRFEVENDPNQKT
jgi:hypothetical protein